MYKEILMKEALWDSIEEKAARVETRLRIHAVYGLPGS